MSVTSASGTNLFLTISAASTARLIAFPLALKRTLSDPSLNCVTTSKTYLITVLLPIKIVLFFLIISSYYTLDINVYKILHKICIININSKIKKMEYIKSK